MLTIKKMLLMSLLIAAPSFAFDFDFEAGAKKSPSKHRQKHGECVVEDPCNPDQIKTFFTDYTDKLISFYATIVPDFHPIEFIRLSNELIEFINSFLGISSTLEQPQKEEIRFDLTEFMKEGEFYALAVKFGGDPLQQQRLEEWLRLSNRFSSALISFGGNANLTELFEFYTVSQATLIQTLNSSLPPEEKFRVVQLITNLIQRIAGAIGTEFETLSCRPSPTRNNERPKKIERDEFWD